MNVTPSPFFSVPRRPFQIIPWDTDFLPPLKDIILQATQGQPGNAVVVFMHDRPKRYLTDVFRHDPNLSRPCLLPRMLTIHELISAMRAETDRCRTHPPTPAGLLDQVALLYTCVQNFSETGTVSLPEIPFDDTASLQQQFTTMDMAAFFPWGTRLARLLEECFVQGLVPDDLHYTEGEVAPFGVALLGSLGRIFQSYGALLQQRNLTTPGFEAYTVTRDLDDATPMPRLLHGKAVILAGFGTLSGTEDTLLRFLWEGTNEGNTGAYVCLHVDPALAGHRQGTPFHWACAGQARWIETWKADTELTVPSSGRSPRLHFFAGYDLHSQLEALRRDLLACGQGSEDFREAPVRPTPSPSSANSADVAPPSAAVTLTHAGALLPVLHNLPRKDCNISLGYPLDRSLLFQLLQTVLEIRDRSLPDGKSHWRSLTDLARHPCLRMLQAGDQPLRRVLQNLEHLLRQGGRHADIHAVARQAIDSMNNASLGQGPPPPSQELAVLLRQVLYCTVDAWKEVKTPGEAGQALATLCETLLQGGKDLWKRFPLDAECLFRLMQRVIPALNNNAMTDTPLPWPLLRSMIQELIHEERVPFEADPLTGLQVLGMLETRLLHFSKVFMVDVTDDQLPGAPTRSPLLPDTLRKVLGLPDTAQREQVAAYTFHRLLASADDVYLYWQEGVEHSGLFDGKKQRSRLVEELIWREEQCRGRLLKPGEEPLRVDTPEMTPPVRERRIIAKTPTIMARLKTMMEKPFSSTLLDAYLRCPMRFYYERLCGLAPPEDVREEDDPAAVGLLIHTVLRRFYEPWQDRPLTLEAYPQRQREQDLLRIFAEELRVSGLEQTLPPESATMLTVAGPERLIRFMRNQPASLCVIHLEKRFETTLTVAGETRRLAGILDRVDRREQGIYIVDYKTGVPKTLASSLWKKQHLWDTMAAALTNDGHPTLYLADRDLLPELSDVIPTLQLLFYAYVYTCNTQEKVYDAAFADLGEEGREIPLFGNANETEGNKENADDNEPQFLKKQILDQYIPDLIGFILLHMQLCPEFRPHEGIHCRWCLWNNLCIL